MKVDSAELVDYICARQRKPWYRYSLTYWRWHLQRIVEFVANRPLCFLGKHGASVGLFHTRLDSEGDPQSFKCYHCPYCNRASDEEWCAQKAESA